MTLTRLNKRLVELGLAPSRRKADKYIMDGWASVDGKVVTNLSTTVSHENVVSVHGETGGDREHIYVAFNKPIGFVATHSAQTDRQKTIFNRLPASFASLKLAGRLDKDSQGLMVLSSDGEFIHKLSHPAFAKEKMYLVTLNKPLSGVDSKKLTTGIKLPDGMSKFDKLSMVRPTQLRITMHEGRNRQIRRSFEALNYHVINLERRRMGKLELGSLKSGEHRFIKPEEVL